ncbi:MAG: hypothetical protein JWQ35_1093 [Bacteriovoracaceae bacterium]|nr:hypothetical protein [Bacteriovoracaceae bacterium]
MMMSIIYVPDSFVRKTTRQLSFAFGCIPFETGKLPERSLEYVADSQAPLKNLRFSEGSLP